MRNIRQLTRLLSYMTHRRINAFWLVALVFLTVPWLFKGCQNNPSLVSADECLVERISDGDTATLRCAGERVRVRYYCIDAPEMSQEPWGTRARDYAREITGRTVRLVRHDTDRYGRTIGTIYTLEGVNTNLELVRTGHAAVYPKYYRDPAYYATERQARAVQAGIWGLSGDHQRPWEYRAARR